MKAEILCVGTELLLGDILNTNAQYLAQELATLGIAVHYQTVVGDNPLRVKEALKIAFERADMVITTGGLGPTKDDLTKEMMAEFFGQKLVLDEEALVQLKARLKAYGLKEISDSNKKQAYLPEQAIPLYNDNGTAPGCIIEDNHKVGIMLPGPPKEMKPLFQKCKELYLNQLSDKIFVSKNLRTYGKGEADAADLLADLLDGENPTVAPYAKEIGVTFRVTASVTNQAEAAALINPVVAEIKTRLGDVIYSETDEEMEEVVVRMLSEQNLTIATAESCTGGLLAGTLVNVPGASKVFLQGAVTYSNEAKTRTLGIKEETLATVGAVSEETAREMAEKVAALAGADIGVSTTGIASPVSDTDKPVGLVYIGIYYNGQTKVKKLNLVGNRQAIRNKAVMAALDIVRRNVKK